MCPANSATKPLRAACVLISLASLLACAHTPKAERAGRAHAGDEPFTTESLRTSVDSVDLARRSVTLRDAEGRPFTIVTGDDDALRRLRPNDPVRLVYQDSVAFQLQEAGLLQGVAPATLQRRASHVLPQRDGAEFLRRVDTVVEILAVSAEGKQATFRIPEGNVRAVEIEDLGNREKIKRLRPGDEVAVVYTERLLLERDR